MNMFKTLMLFASIVFSFVAFSEDSPGKSWYSPSGWEGCYNNVVITDPYGFKVEAKISQNTGKIEAEEQSAEFTLWLNDLGSDEQALYYMIKDTLEQALIARNEVETLAENIAANAIVKIDSTSTSGKISWYTGSIDAKGNVVASSKSAGSYSEPKYTVDKNGQGKYQLKKDSAFTGLAWSDGGGSAAIKVDEISIHTNNTSSANGELALVNWIEGPSGNLTSVSDVMTKPIGERSTGERYKVLARTTPADGSTVKPSLCYVDIGYLNTNAIESISWLTNEVIAATNTLYSAGGVTNQICVITNTINSITNMMTWATNEIVAATNEMYRVGGLTNTLYGMTWTTNELSAATNILYGAGGVTNSVNWLTNEVVTVTNQMVSITNDMAWVTNEVIWATNQIVVITNVLYSLTNEMNIVTNAIDFTTNAMIVVTNQIETITNSMIVITNMFGGVTNSISATTNTLNSISNNLWSVIDNQHAMDHWSVWTNGEQKIEMFNFHKVARTEDYDFVPVATYDMAEDGEMREYIDWYTNDIPALAKLVFGNIRKKPPKSVVNGRLADILDWIISNDRPSEGIVYQYVTITNDPLDIIDAAELVDFESVGTNGEKIIEIFGFSTNKVDGNIPIVRYNSERGSYAIAWEQAPRGDSNTAVPDWSNGVKYGSIETYESSYGPTNVLGLREFANAKPMSIPYKMDFDADDEYQYLGWLLTGLGNGVVVEDGDEESDPHLRIQGLHTASTNQMAYVKNYGTSEHPTNDIAWLDVKNGVEVVYDGFFGKLQLQGFDEANDYLIPVKTTTSSSVEQESNIEWREYYKPDNHSLTNSTMYTAMDGTAVEIMGFGNASENQVPYKRGDGTLGWKDAGSKIKVVGTNGIEMDATNRVIFASAEGCDVQVIPTDENGDVKLTVGVYYK